MPIYGCGYKMTLCLAEAENMYYKESDIPDRHYEPDGSPDNIRTDRKAQQSLKNYLLIINSITALGPLDFPESKFPT
jgi:hypothetical protein